MVVNDNNQLKISIPVINQIREYCYSLAEHSGDKAFETEHIKKVERYALELADVRKLKTDIVNLIAVLHDIGRTKNGIYGKGHAKASAAEAKIILKKFEINKKSINTITRAISNHNKKRKIHGKYSELIKDADSMARYSKVPDFNDGSREFLRNKYARIGKCIISNIETADAGGILYDKIKEIKINIEKMSGEAIAPADVHEIRVDIRIARSIIWYIKKSANGNCRVLLEILDKDLRDIFKDYETARRTHVFRKKIKGQISSGKLMDYLDKAKKNAYGKLREKVSGKHRTAIEKIMEKAEIISPSCGTKSTDSIPDNKPIQQIIKSANIQDFNSMHRLRILCKKLIYLQRTGIITFSQPDFIELLKALHNNIGLLNDRIDNEKMLKKIYKDKPGITHKKQFASILNLMTDMENTKEQIDSNLFEMNIRI